MGKGILGRKIGMTQIFADNGEAIPVTVVEAEPNIVLQTKTVESDGYEAVQLGFADKKESRSNKPEKGHSGKAETKPKRFIKEIAGLHAGEYEVGREVKVDTFTEGEVVDVIGTSKGKGFQGSIKRHNQHRGPMTHGSHYHRSPGALGSIDPMRVYKGRKLPGRMGGKRVTVQNLSIVQVDTERNLLLIRGNVPGARKSHIIVQSAVKAAEAK